MKKNHKKLKYFLVNLIVGIILCAFELMSGFGAGIFPCGSGGECNTYITLGGNVLSKYYPLLGPGETFTGDPYDIYGNPITFAIMFLLRFIIIIPIVNFIDSKREDSVDFTEYFKEDQRHN